MAANNKTAKITLSEGKLVQYQEQGNLAFQLLVKSQLMEKQISFEELVKYSLMPVPPSLGPPDGYFAKTNKAKVIHYLANNTSKCTNPPENTFNIEDGAAVFHMMKDVQATFGMICMKVLDIISTKRNIDWFIFSTFNQISKEEVQRYK